MRELIRRILQRPVGILVASCAVIAMGVLSFLNIPLQMLPEGFEERHITIRANLRESSPAEAERLVAIPIEEALGTVAGIESISSRCERDSVRVSLDLKKDADPATVERDVRDRVARVEADLPDDVERLRVRREGANDRPVLFYAVTAPVDRLELSDFVEDAMLPRIESVDGIARASAWGRLRRSVRIFLDNEEVARRNIDLREVLGRLRGDNVSKDLGDITEGSRKAFLRASMEFESLDDIRAFPVLEGLKLGDIARVEVVPGIDQGYSRYNGQSVLVGTVYKAAGANTVEACRRIRVLFDEIQNNPKIEGLAITPFFDQGSVIENSLTTLYKNALYGGLLAIVILYGFFRRLRMTLLVAAALPLSLTIALTCLYLAGDSLNLGTMMGLTLAVGMLIDNAIVVVESILRRRELGDDPGAAAATGTGEVALAVVTATLTTIVVFLPAIFLGGGSDVRIWLGSIGFPIAYSLLASLAVALVLVPLGSIYLRRGRQEVELADPVARADAETGGWYGRLLGAALRHRFLVVVLGLAVVLSTGLGFSLVDRTGASGAGGPVRVRAEFPRHYEPIDANEVVKTYEQYVLSKKDELEIEGVYTRFDEYGAMTMVWKRDDSDKPRDEIRDALAKDWPKIPGVRTSLESAGEQGTTTVTLEGEDAGALERAMDRIEKRLQRLPSVKETQRERAAGLQELQIRADPEAVKRGQVAPEGLRGMLGWVLRGARLRDYRSRGRDLPVLLELDPEQDLELSDLDALRIPTEQGMKPLESLARSEIRSAPTAIDRRDGRRASRMEVVGGPGDAEDFHRQVQAELRRVKLPPGVRFKVGGSWQDLQESFAEFLQALGLGGILVFLLTGILFEALLLPLAVILAVLPALAGMVWALVLVGKPLDPLAQLGGILLIGVVVNNGIVLIDRVQQWRARGLPLRAAVRAAGRDRVRPVLMTAITTIAGLLPMAVFKGANDEIQYDTLATGVIGGLVVSTVVTLVFVPVAYTLFADLSRLTSRGLRRAASIRSAAPTE